jgi:hypothetical protein
MIMAFLLLIVTLVTQSGLRYTVSNDVRNVYDVVVVSLTVSYKGQPIFAAITRDDQITYAEVLVKDSVDDGYRDFTPRERARYFMALASTC